MRDNIWIVTFDFFSGQKQLEEDAARDPSETHRRPFERFTQLWSQAQVLEKEDFGYSPGFWGRTEGPGWWAEREEEDKELGSESQWEPLPAISGFEKQIDGF